MKHIFPLRIFLTVTWSLAVLTSLSDAEHFTSSVRMRELAQQEHQLLQELKNYISSLQRFVQVREAAFQATNEESYISAADHPNAAFLLIKAHIYRWQLLVSNESDFRNHISKEVSMPTMEDYSGVADSVLRLQNIYKLTAADIVKGNYSGYIGPRLSSLDAYFIGKQAFLTNNVNRSREWLEIARDVRRTEKTDDELHKLVMTQLQRSDVNIAKAENNDIIGAILGLLGRTYLYSGDRKKAKKAHKESKPYASVYGDVAMLGQELDNKNLVNPFQNQNSADPNFPAFQELCTRPKNQPVEERKNYHRCRYKPSQHSYDRYKEEILSLAPYVSLFYDIMNDVEMENVIKYVKDKMSRSRVEGTGHLTGSSVRISDVGWIYDEAIPEATRLSARIQDITRLQVLNVLQPMNVTASAEPLQLVNYGIGGHYNAHFDPLDKNPGGFLGNSGTRIATFLIYLSDVDIGGSTVFVNAGISVAPVKGMALFWYNQSPAMNDDERDYYTMHAGCPVLKGQKWIANKWIWTYGNTFKRPCGPSPNSTQLEIEQILTK